MRFESDFEALSEKFVAHAERSVWRDATCLFRGRVLGAPQHFRGQKVTLHYAVMRPEVVWIDDGGTRDLLRDVDVVANSKRPRIGSKVARTKPQQEQKKQPSTGINGVESMIQRALKFADAASPESCATGELDEEGGLACKLS